MRVTLSGLEDHPLQRADAVLALPGRVKEQFLSWPTIVPGLPSHEPDSI